RQFNAGVLWAEIVGVKVLPHARVGVLAQEDELRQVLVERPQAVVNPRADDRLSLIEGVPAGVHLELSAVVVVGRVYRADEGDVIDAAGQVRQPIADFHAALAMALEADLERKDAREQIAVRADDRARALQVERRALRIGKRSFLIGPPGIAIESRLGVKGFK